MVVITVEACQNSREHTTNVKNKDFFWVKMKNIQYRLGIKNISDLLRKEICGRFGTKELTEKQKMKYIRSEYQITKHYKLVEKIIKNYRGVKKCNVGASKLDKEDQ